MSSSIYVVASEPRSGKAVIALGVLAAIARRVGRIGVFRPVAHAHETEETFANALRTQAGVELTVWSGTDVGAVEAASRGGWWDRLLEDVVTAYHEQADDLDFVLIIGTDFSDAASGRSLDMNASIARDIGSPIVLVESGFERSVQDVVTAASMHRSVVTHHGCTIAATIINRVTPDLVESVRGEIRGIVGDELLDIVPEDEDLAAPTLAEIQRALDAEVIIGTERDLWTRDARALHVGAMQGPEMLGRLAEGSVVITAGDRTDVVLASALAQATESGPHLSGLVLTGGIPLHPRVLRLLEEFPAGRLPVLSVKTNTLKTAEAILSLRPRVSAAGTAKMRRAVAVVEDAINVDALVARVISTKVEGVTPAMFEHQLMLHARASKRHIVLPEGTEPRIIRAAAQLIARNVAQLTLLGPEAEIRQTARALGVDLGDAELIDPETAEIRATLADAYYQARKHKGVHRDAAFERMADVSYFGTMMVHLGMADGMVSGAVHTTGHTIRPALQVIRTRPESSVVSSVFFMAMPDRVLVYGDCAVNPNPTPEELAVIAIDSAHTAARFGVEPRVAMLSYSTGVSGHGVDVDKVRKATEIVREKAPDLLVEGPIQYDAAISPDVAATKMPDSPVAGRATVFIFPDLNTGNNTYKAVQRSSGALAVGPVLQGLNKPVNDLSRGCTVPDIINTVAITAIQAQS